MPLPPVDGLVWNHIVVCEREVSSPFLYGLAPQVWAVFPYAHASFAFFPFFSIKAWFLIKENVKLLFTFSRLFQGRFFG